MQERIAHIQAIVQRQCDLTEHSNVAVEADEESVAYCTGDINTISGCSLPQDGLTIMRNPTKTDINMLLKPIYIIIGMLKHIHKYCHSQLSEYNSFGW